VQGTDARESGIRNLPFLITLLFAPILSGGLISLFGPYVPFMWFGACLATVGSGLLFSLQVGTKSSAVAAYQFLAGLGLGSCTQISYIATQYKLPDHQTVMGTTIVSFCNSLGPVLGTNIAQAIFAGTLAHRLKSVPGIDPASVIRAGPANIGELASSTVRPLVRQAYKYALTTAFIPAVICGGIAFCCSLWMEWGNVRKKKSES
jgi:MFS family permease